MQGGPILPQQVGFATSVSSCFKPMPPDHRAADGGVAIILDLLQIAPIFIELPHLIYR